MPILLAAAFLLSAAPRPTPSTGAAPSPLPPGSPAPSAEAGKALPLAALVELPASVKPGEALVALVSSTALLGSGSIEVRRVEGGFRMTLPGMAVAVRPEGSQAGNGILFLVPLPMDLLPGSLSVLLSWKEDGRQSGRASTAIIEKREWESQDISLTPALKEIVASPDPRKARESEILNAILLSRNPGECLLDGGVSQPLKERYRTSLFGYRRRYLYPKGGSSTSIHWGIDLKEGEGHPVKASASGTVVLAAERALTGNSVVIRHGDGLFSIYYHLASLAVKEGQRIGKGQVLGAVGSTGFSTGPHLHWEFRLLGTAIDPDGLVAARVLDKIRPTGTIQSP